MIHSFEKCSKCGRTIVETLSHRARGTTLQQCCGQRAVIVEEEVGDAAELLGFRVGERIEADLYRGGIQDDDGITRGSRLVTKRGEVNEVFIASYNNVFLAFDDGDIQVTRAEALDGATPGYPCAAFRRVTTEAGSTDGGVQ